MTTTDYERIYGVLNVLVLPSNLPCLGILLDQYMYVCKQWRIAEILQIFKDCRVQIFSLPDFEVEFKLS